LFEGKADHTTYFGTKTEYIQGIHMIPLLATSPYIRKASFVQEEWDTYFSNGRFDDVETSWKGILLANYATCDPEGVMDTLMGQFDATWLDGGASRTWYLAYVGGLQKLGVAS
jgi:endo-1,3(4)-beta-glucanase